MEISLVVILLFFGSLQTFAVKNGSGKLLVILLDGFRWDYFKYDGFREDGLKKFIREGTRAESLVPTYPTNSYPNYYSLMTGLYPEEHGFIGNFMHDVTRNQSFLIGRNEEHKVSHWWNDGDPVWVTATRQKKNTYMFYWPGCNAEIRGLRPRFCDPYAGIPTLRQFRSAINQSLELFQNGSADLAAIYYEDIDAKGHMNGPFSKEINNTLKSVDGAIAYLLDEMDRRHIRDKVDVMIASDHGMADVSNVPDHGIINISSLFTAKEKCIFMDLGSHVIVFTSEKYVRQVYKKLKNFHPHMKVYLKHEIPHRWHYKNGRLVAPITLVADLGYFIVTPFQPNFPTRDDGKPWKGWHGYDNNIKEMSGIFIASGPSFKKNYVAPSLEIVQLYQVMCRILDIEPSPNNGSWSQVSEFLQLPQSSAGHLDKSTLLTVFSLVLYLGT